MSATNRTGRPAAASEHHLALTIQQLHTLIEGLELLAIEHHHQSLVADDPTEAGRHRRRELAVDQLRARLDLVIPPDPTMNAAIVPRSDLSTRTGQTITPSNR